MKEHLRPPGTRKDIAACTGEDIAACTGEDTAAAIQAAAEAIHGLQCSGAPCESPAGHAEAVEECKGLARQALEAAAEIASLIARPAQDSGEPVMTSPQPEPRLTPEIRLDWSPPGEPQAVMVGVRIRSTRQGFFLPGMNRAEVSALRDTLDAFLAEEVIMAPVPGTTAAGTETPPSTAEQPPHVAPGQIWAACDPRMAGRTVQVERIEAGRADCVILTNTDGTWEGQKDRRGQDARIALSRFRPGSTGSTGYRQLSQSGPAWESHYFCHTPASPRASCPWCAARSLPAQQAPQTETGDPR